MVLCLQMKLDPFHARHVVHNIDCNIFYSHRVNTEVKQKEPPSPVKVENKKVPETKPIPQSTVSNFVYNANCGHHLVLK